jgi:hypothetical protein
MSNTNSQANAQPQIESGVTDPVKTVAHYLPPEWEGYEPFEPVDTLPALADWLAFQLWMVNGRELEGENAKVAALQEASQVIRNAFRLLDWLGVKDRPDQQLTADDIETATKQLDQLEQWIRQKHKPSRVVPVKRDQSVRMRSWTQGDLNDAIRKYKAQRASTYPALVDAVKKGRPGAISAARKMFGRNAIAKKLSVRAPAMVSNSEAWREIASELQLDKKNNAGRPRKRTGLDDAVAESSEASSDSAFDEAVRNETLRLIQRALPREVAEALSNQLSIGTTSDDKARQIIEAYQEQEKDKKRKRVLPSA